MRIVTARPHPPPAGGRAPVEHRQASFLLALVPVLFLVAVLGVNVLVYHGSPHIPLLLSAGVAALIGWRLGHTWRQLERGIVHGISMAVQACLILLVVGMLIGTWIVSGIVPAMIFYGLQIVSPSYFLVASCLICSIISLATGSSWSTAGTVGIALIGIGQGLGFPLPLVAGAIVSGSYLGDKMSPLSDTTNLAPAIAGTDIFKHISHMMFTTLPSFLIALTIYTVIGIFYKSNLLQMNTIEQILQVLQTQFTIHPVLLSPPLLVIVMVIFRL
ncbi:MAG: hypothetical protein FJ125_17825, partial [Deltaproteobacteria bacterium]|nr:hypothetical protein [Deltaproteobacteria bacterium]